MKVFILVFCCLIALAAFWFGIKLIRLYLRVGKWQKIKAVVTNKFVSERKQSSASRAGYKVNINYTYEINSKPFSGDKVFLVELMKGERGFMKRPAEIFIERFPGEKEVFVNPENPEESVIFREGIGLYIFILIIGSACLLIGIGNFLS